MSETEKKTYDLEERTARFAARAVPYFNSLPRSMSNVEVAKQGIRSSCSIGANFIEANEAVSRKDFILRIKICRKEAKETIYWLRLSQPIPAQMNERQALIQEATELMKIFGAIIEKSNSKISRL